MFYASTTRVAPMPPTPLVETLIFLFFPPRHDAAFVLALCTQSAAEDIPRCPKSAKKEPKSLLLGAQNVTFRYQIGENGPLLKHQQGLCFRHILRVRAPLFLLLNSPRERTAHRDCSFSPFWLHFWRPSGTQGRPKGAQRSQREPQSLPRDT